MGMTALRSSNQPISGECFISYLPVEVIQNIATNLNLRDIGAFSRTCRSIHEIIDNDDFWSHQIHVHFPRSIARFYTNELFHEPKLIEFEPPQKGSMIQSSRAESNFDQLAERAATVYDDDAIKKQNLKMFASRQDLVNTINYYQYQKNQHFDKVPLMKLIFLYLRDRKRLATVQMEAVHRNTHYLVEEKDETCLLGAYINLRTVCWLEITGRFPHQILPGKYRISWRMKFTDPSPRMWGNTEFLVVPTEGQMKNYVMNENDFRSLALEHREQWFTMSMGEILIFKPSIVHCAIRNWSNGNWKSGIAWDCIELTIVL